MFDKVLWWRQTLGCVWVSKRYLGSMGGKWEAIRVRMKIISGIWRSFYKDDFMLLNQEYLSKFEASRWTVLTHNKNYEVSLQRKKLLFERRCATDKNIPERTKSYCTTLVSLPNDSNYVNDLFFEYLLCVVTSTFLKPVQTVNLFFCSLLHIHKQLFTTVFVPQKVEESKDADTHCGELRKARSLSQPKRGSFRLFQIRKTVFGAAEK